MGYSEKEELQAKSLKIIQQSPGITFKQVLKQVRVPNPFLFKATSVLVEQGLIESQVAGQVKYLYPKGKAPEFVLTPMQKKILEKVRENQGLSMAEISAAEKSMAHNMLRNLRILEGKHLVYTQKEGTKRLVYLQTVNSTVKPSTEEEAGEAMSLSDEEIEILLRTQGNSISEIKSELGGAGGRIECLVSSILIKYKVETLQEAREIFSKSQGEDNE